ncbi:MAG: FMN-binding protein [Gammaproteobacteria bacterium]
MNRRDFNRYLIALGASSLLIGQKVWAKSYITFEQAKKIMWQDLEMVPFEYKMNKDQMKRIKENSKTRVRNNVLKGLKSSSNDFLIADQVIGKHEFIDVAVGIDSTGTIRGVEILTYRESYGDEVMNQKWRNQFLGVSSNEILELDDQIKNISGATMSCRHITDGINRLTHTWKEVLQYI